ncbi:hypothetical protein QJU93_07190 [Pasteurella skyensis]|uniref:Uncharacterized protein n=1 Tax=Phocoenobacter skyensis TaxID=97481 RepID=A0AAJ6NAF6_9PAST|nr:hypothetical protein [Pasteurella skyensis]MDP8173140.1 hypothetical protein [Pasteurella skyensis]MDP8178927.1 hypothetical protein [Pasteurella skyensis]
MTQKLTEHSRKLRSKTAQAHTKKQLAEGVVRQVLIKAPTEVLNEFDTIAQELGLSRPKLLEFLCKQYRDNQ